MVRGIDREKPGWKSIVGEEKWNISRYCRGSNRNEALRSSIKNVNRKTREILGRGKL